MDKSSEAAWTAIHKRIDDMFAKLSEVDSKLMSLATSMERIAQIANEMQGVVSEHSRFIDGTNGEKGAKARLNALEYGKTDTLSIGAVKMLLAGFSAVIIALGTALAIALGRTPAPLP